MATLPELTLLISTTFLLLPALRLMKKSRSSSRCFCVILEVLCVFFSIFFQCLTPYSVICSLAVATLFLNYLRNLRWHITMLQTQWKSTRGQRTNHNIHLMYQQLIPFTKNIANTLSKRDLTETQAISDTGGKDEKKQRTHFRLKTPAEIWNFTSRTE